MKNYTLLALLLVSGCSIINMSRYNQNEHLLVNKIRTVSELNEASCNDPVKMQQVSKLLHETSVELYNYNDQMTNNQESIKMTKELVNMTKGLNDRYNADTKASESFCKIKMQTINETSKAIEYSIVRKPK